MKRVLVTGATGFVGSVLRDMLVQSGYLVRVAGRSAHSISDDAMEYVVVGDLGSDLRWQEALAGVDGVVHLAARAHILGDSLENAHLYRQANAVGTMNLAWQAAEAGVRQFVFLSSIKVNGEFTTSHPFTTDDKPQPQDAYGSSKCEAEQFVLSVAKQTQMRVAIIRSPLVYGPGVKANFLRLMRWVDKEKFLPLGSVKNERSLVSVWNLCGLILRLLAEPLRPTGIWMVSDGHDLSTPELVRRLAHAMGRRARLLPIPVEMLQFLGHAIGYRAQIARLCGSLVIDITKTCDELGWSPLVSLEEGLARTAHWYLSEAQYKS